MHTTGRISVVCIVLLLSLPVGAGFNFGITPSKTDEGVQNPGDRFFTSFFVVSGENEELEVQVDTGTADVNAFKNLRKREAENFSEQQCDDCFQFLKAGGALEDYDKEGSINQWKSVEFFVDVPEDAEPGYHMLTVKPRPVRTSGGGSVGVVSSASFPVIFRVPGHAVRSTRILGVHTAKTFNDQQNIVTTLYNDGTVTVTSRIRLIIETEDGNKTLRAGTRRLAPGETVDVTGRVDTEELKLRNDTFTAYAVADYTTGTSRFTSTLTPREPSETPDTSGAITQKQPGSQRSYGVYLAAILVLLASTFLTWKVMRRVRY